MHRDDVISLLGQIPEEDMPKVVFMVRGAMPLNVELIFRLDPKFIIFRGRESGTNDDGRAFFLPYDDIIYMKLERMVTVPQLEAMFGAATTSNASDDPFADAPAASAIDTPAPVEANLDPAAIAKQNLLERIRAARTSAGMNKPGAK